VLAGASIGSSPFKNCICVQIFERVVQIFERIWQSLKNIERPRSCPLNKKAIKTGRYHFGVVGP
jgi:hypothetical protein